METTNRIELEGVLDLTDRVLFKHVDATLVPDWGKFLEAMENNPRGAFDGMAKHGFTVEHGDTRDTVTFDTPRECLVYSRNKEVVKDIKSFTCFVWYSAGYLDDNTSGVPDFVQVTFRQIVP